MATEFRGKIKEELWLRSICTDDEPLRKGLRARRDFMMQSREEEGEIGVAAPDVLAEAFDELGDSRQSGGIGANGELAFKSLRTSR